MSDAFGRSWQYSFRALDCEADDTKARKFVAAHKIKFSAIAKNLDTTTNSEWVARIYLAGRLIMASTLYFNTYEHLLEANARVIVPFLQYYGVLFAMRAVVLTSPHQEWKSGDLLKITHTKAINFSSQVVAQICPKEFSVPFKQRLVTLKAHRELISYIAPLSGDADASGFDRDVLIDMITILSEIAQLQSEILEGAVGKHTPKTPPPEIDLQQIEAAFRAIIEGHDFVDREDRYRLDFLRRKNPFITNVRDMITAGEADEFFGAWCSKDDLESDHIFDPDKKNRAIFDIT